MTNNSIDQSGKIEQTNKNTVLCLANGTWDSVLLTAKVKRQLQEMFRRKGQPRKFVLLTFSAILGILLLKNSDKTRITIDREYYGKEDIISNTIDEMFTLNKLPKIKFGHVGKNSNAHKYAHKIAVGELKSKKLVSLGEILKILSRVG